MNTLSLAYKGYTARFFAAVTIVSLLLSAFPAAFFIANAADTLTGPTSIDVDNTVEFSTGAFDASGYENLVLSFNYDAESIDVGDTYTYGWRSATTDNNLATVGGTSEPGTPGDETGSVSIGLPVGAQVADLEIYIQVNANTAGPNDDLNITNLIVEGDAVVVAPSTVNITNVTELRDAIENQVAGQTWTIQAGDYGMDRFTGITAGGPSSPQTGWYFPITEDDITINGVGNPTIFGDEYSANGALSTQNLVTVFGDNVTITGLTLMPKVQPNKTLEVIGEDFTLENVVFKPNTKVDPTRYDNITDLDDREFSKEWGGSLYFSKGGTHVIKDVTIHNGGVSFSSGAIGSGTTIEFDNVEIVKETANDFNNSYRYSSGFSNGSNSTIGLPQVTYRVNDTLNNSTSSLANAKDGDTIELDSDITVSEELSVITAVTINGNGNTISPDFTKDSTSGNNSVLQVNADGVTINDLIIDGTGGTNLHGINTYKIEDLELNDVTLLNNDYSGLVVNGSTVTVTNITTSGNGWHSINAANGVGVTDTTLLTVNKTSSHTEQAQIWVDDISQPVTIDDADDQYEITFEGPHPNPKYQTTARNYTLKSEPDTTNPTITVKDNAITCESGDGYEKVSFALFDAGDIDRLTINGIEMDRGNNPYSDFNNVEPGKFGGVEGTNVLQVFDAAGNMTELVFTLCADPADDSSAPTATIKTGDNFITTCEAGYSKLSYKLRDAGGQIDRVVINGVVKDLSDNEWSDINFLAPGVFGAKAGNNTMVVYDVDGNNTTYEFFLCGAAVQCQLPYTVEFTSSSDESTFSTTPGTGLVIEEVTGGYKIGLYDDGRTGVYRVQGTITFPAGTDTSTFAFSEESLFEGLEQSNPLYPDVANRTGATIDFDLYVNGANDIFTITDAALENENNCSVVFPEPTAQIITTKIACENESSLPNGDYSVIDANTATAFLAENPSCYLQEGVAFQWAAGEFTSSNVPSNNGAAPAPWNISAPTGVDGMTTMTVPVSALEDQTTVSVREVLDTDKYLTFSDDKNDNVSAEMYCNTDVKFYDNMEWITDFGEEETYYCVAWNVPVEPVVTTCELPIYSDAGTVITDTNKYAVAAKTNDNWTKDIDGATWIWATDRTENPGQTETYNFVETFTVDNPTSALVSVAADNFYRVYVNGDLVPELDRNGPDSNFRTAALKSDIDISSYLNPNGENTIRFEVTNKGVAGSNSIQNPAGVLYRIDVVGDKNSCAITTEPEVVEEPEVPEVVVETGTIQVCKVYVDANSGVIDPSQLSSASFTVPGTNDVDFTPVKTGAPITNAVFDTTNGLNTDLNGDQRNDAYCVTETYDLGKSYLYGEETKSGADASDWTFVGRNDQFNNAFDITNPISGLSVADTDGEIVLAKDATQPAAGTNTARQLVVVNQLTEDTTGGGDDNGGGVEEGGTNDDDASPARRNRGGSSSSGTQTDRFSFATAPAGEVLGASTVSVCPFLIDYMQMGVENDSLEVMKLQIFLNIFKDMFGGTESPVTGTFGSVTDKNVKLFQQRFQTEILDPWFNKGIVPHNRPTGFVYKTTLWKINSIVCPDTAVLPEFSGEDLSSNVDID